ncbi:unnamed protein product [Cladocopium goreaui]|uniref:Uncharacterized protein n=1 Tax=Cladocopium goreaui TaxID=2562237 RepID=A0A9P1GKH4_9DINO|nr:unnamed protein product [Cladocopium goreaui]
MGSLRSFLRLAGLCTAHNLAACEGDLTLPSKFLQYPRSALSLPLKNEQLRTMGTAPTASTVPLTYVEVEFKSTADPSKSVVVPRALVDTGSSDCELREGFFQKIQPLRSIQQGVLYETVTGAEAYDVYEVEISILGKRGVAALTLVPESRFSPDAEDACTDDAIVGHMALAALGLLVDPAHQRVLRPEDLRSPEL